MVRYVDSKGVVRFKGGRHLKESQSYPRQLLGFNIGKFAVFQVRPLLFCLNSFGLKGKSILPTAATGFQHK